MIKYDACVVLGGGITNDGQVSSTSKARVDDAFGHYKNGEVSLLLMSGLGSWRHGSPPRVTEAKVMFNYAVSLGLNPKAILQEEKSKDTISNAYFCKIDFALPRNWQRLLVITSSHHLPRTEYTFGKVFGGEFDIDFVGVEALGTRHKQEDKIFPIIKSYLDPITPGDHEAVGKLLHKVHPGFNNDPASRAKLLEQIEN